MIGGVCGMGASDRRREPRGKGTRPLLISIARTEAGWHLNHNDGNRSRFGAKDQHVESMAARRCGRIRRHRGGESRFGANCHRQEHSSRFHHGARVERDEGRNRLPGPARGCQDSIQGSGFKR